jgi:beta-lactamase regulating signal transducer with metallopeptidase domain/Flp pilus assembly protein TadD
MATIFELAARLQSAHVAEELLLILAKATLILLIARLLLAATPRASAATKHLVATAALVAVACMPLLSVAVPAWNIVVVTKPAPAPDAVETSKPVEHRRTIGVADDEPVGIAKTFAKVIAPAPVTAMERINTLVRSSWKGMVVLLAAVIALLMLAQMAIGMIGVRRVVRDARELEDDVAFVELDRARDQLALRADVRLLQSERVTVPLVWGVFRPVLLLPVEAAEWSAEKLRVVLLHELAHLKRVDGISLILTRIAVSLFWFHPVAWSLERAGRSECERACDDLVLAGGTKPSEYADHLLEIARTMPAFEPYRAVTLAMSRKSQLEGRLLSILQPAGARRVFSGRTVAIACALAVAVIVPVSALRLIAQQAPVLRKAVQPKTQTETRTDSTITVKPHEESLENYLSRTLDEYDGNYADKHQVKYPPDSPEDWYQYAYDLYKNDQFEKAGEAFLTASRESREPDPRSLYNAACSFALNGDASRASQALADALEAGWDDLDDIAEDSDFDPVRGDARFRAVLAKYGEGDIATRREKRALQTYEDLRSGKRNTHDDDGDEWYEAGMDLLRLRRLDESIDAFRHSMQLGEKSAAAAYNIACAYSLRGDVRGGLEWLDESIELGFGDESKLLNDPDITALRDDSQFRSLLHKADDLELRSHDDTDWVKAAAHHLAMTAKYPDSARAWFNYGYTALQARQYDNALSAFRKTVEMNYRPGTSSYNIACAYALQGNHDAAFDWLQRADAAGFELGRYLAEDEDLDALRRDPRFEALRERFPKWTKKRK